MCVTRLDDEFGNNACLSDVCYTSIKESTLMRETRDGSGVAEREY